MEKDYQQVIAIMEAELAESKRQAESDRVSPENQIQISWLEVQEKQRKSDLCGYERSQGNQISVVRRQAKKVRSLWLGEKQRKSI